MQVGRTDDAVDCKSNHAVETWNFTPLRRLPAFVDEFSKAIELCSWQLRCHRTMEQGNEELICDANKSMCKTNRTLLLYYAFHLSGSWSPSCITDGLEFRPIIPQCSPLSISLFRIWFAGLIHLFSVCFIDRGKPGKARRQERSRNRIWSRIHDRFSSKI